MVRGFGGGLLPQGDVLPPLSNSWILSIIWLYIALKRTPYIDGYWVGAVPNLNPKPLRIWGSRFQSGVRAGSVNQYIFWGLGFRV